MQRMELTGGFWPRVWPVRDRFTKEKPIGLDTRGLCVCVCVRVCVCVCVKAPRNTVLLLPISHQQKQDDVAAFRFFSFFQMFSRGPERVGGGSPANEDTPPHPVQTYLHFRFSVE